MNNILISVIVPSYCGVKYIQKIEKCVYRSAEEAGIINEIELIFVNDSPEVKITTSHTNSVVLINQKNMGVHYSRVKGLKYARGKYVHMLDQDDVISKSFYKIALSSIGDNDCFVANSIIEHNDYKRFGYRSWFGIWMVDKPWANVFFGTRRTSPGQCIILKKAIPDEWMNNILINNGSDDYFLWMLMFEYKKKTIVNSTALYMHKNTGDNISNDDCAINKSDIEMVGMYNELFPNSSYAIALGEKYNIDNSNNFSIWRFADKVILNVKKISRKLRG